MSNYYVMVKGHRIAVGESDSLKGIKDVYDALSEYDGYKGKMKVLKEVDFFDVDGEPRPYPFPDLDSLIDEEETHS